MTPMDERREAGYKRLPLLKSSLALPSQSEVQKGGNQSFGDKDWVDAKTKHDFNEPLHSNPAQKTWNPSRASYQDAVLHCKYHSGLPNYQRSDRSTGNAIHLIGSTAGGSSQIAHCTGATAAPLSDSPRAWAYLCTTLLGAKPCFSSLLAPNSSPHIVSGCQQQPGLDIMSPYSRTSSINAFLLQDKFKLLRYTHRILWTFETQGTIFRTKQKTDIGQYKDIQSLIWHSSLTSQCSFL